jgi:hypothetical protein
LTGESLKTTENLTVCTPKRGDYSTVGLAVWLQKPNACLDRFYYRTVSLSENSEA